MKPRHATCQGAGEAGRWQLVCTSHPGHTLVAVIDTQGGARAGAGAAAAAAVALAAVLLRPALWAQWGGGLGPQAAAFAIACLLALGVTLGRRPGGTAESLRSIAGLGLLHETWAGRVPSPSGGAPPTSTAFYPWSSVTAVFVHEGVAGCEVRFYLALVLVGRAHMLLPFRDARLRLPALLAAVRAIEEGRGVGPTPPVPS
jgi:hypothetical protein